MIEGKAGSDEQTGKIIADEVVFLESIDFIPLPLIPLNIMKKDILLLWMPPGIRPFRHPNNSPRKFDCGR
jgi:hypothetical protein